MLTGSDLGTKHVHYRWCMVYRHVQLLMDVAWGLDIYWVVNKIPQMMTKLIVWAFIASIGYVTLIKEDSFGAETWLITQNLKPEKGCVLEKL